jgi:hypothetical protein
MDYTNQDEFEEYRKCPMCGNDIYTHKCKCNLNPNQDYIKKFCDRVNSSETFKYIPGNVFFRFAENDYKCRLEVNKPDSRGMIVFIHNKCKEFFKENDSYEINGYLLDSFSGKVYYYVPLDLLHLFV